MKNLIYFFLCFLLVASNALGANYYCDPTTGKMSNPGTSELPWSRLDSVFIANKTFTAGDTIILRGGYHGFPVVTGINADYVTIKPQGTDTVKVKKLRVENASKWIISGLTVSPEIVGSYEGGDFVSLRSTASYITLQNCFIYSVSDTSGWKKTDWETKTGNGVVCEAPYSLVTRNLIKTTLFSLVITQTGLYSVASYNTIDVVVNDAIRGLGNYSKYEYNLVKNFIVNNGNHDDIFQSWSGGTGGVPSGGSTVYGVEIRGNVFLNQTNPNLSLAATDVQGIGCFDGMFEDWIVENNLVATNHWHGITILGAKNCRVVNNTVAQVPGITTTMIPWIQIGPHKNATPATGNLVRNNITSFMNNIPDDASVGTVDYNIVCRWYGVVYVEYSDLFVDYANYNFHLKAGSQAINAGSTAQAPTIDIAKYPRTAPYDIGCYEYGSVDGINTSAASIQPNTFELLQNYPNPFNPTTVISYRLSVNSYVTLKIIDLLGREIAVLQNGMQRTGNYTTTFNGAKLASGIYLSRLTVTPESKSTNLIILTKKMLLTK